MQLTIKTDTKGITTQTWESWQAFSVDMASQKQTKIPTKASAQKTWLKSRPQILFGSVDNEGKVVSRTALVLHLSYIPHELGTPDALFDQFSRSAMLNGVLIMDPDTGLNQTMHASLVLPLDRPLTVDAGDTKLYDLMLKMRLKRLRDLGIIAQVPRLRLREWDQWLPYPVRNQTMTQTVYYIDGRADLPLDGVREAATQRYIETVEPDGMLKDRLAAKQFIAHHMPSDILHIFVHAQQKWLQDPLNLQACLLHLRVAENAGRIRSAQIPDLLQILAGKDTRLYDQLESTYADTQQRIDELAGLRFFVQDNALGASADWLYFTESGQPRVDAEAFTQSFMAKHPMLSNQYVPGEFAYYDDTFGHWVFGRDAKNELKNQITLALGRAHAFHIPLRNECLSMITAEVEDLTKNKMKGHSADSPFDFAPKHYVEFENATYDLNTNQFIEKSPEHYQSRYVPVTMKTEGFEKPEVTLSWLDGLVGHDQDALTTLVRFIGYSFTHGYPHQVMLIILGGGGNGKTTLLKYISSLFGKDRTSAVSWHDLTNPNDRFSTMQLIGKYANIAGDMGTVKTLAAQRLKGITGGDRIKVEEKGQPAFTTGNEAKLFFATNQLPAVNDYTVGFKRRIRLITLPINFEAADIASLNRINAFNAAHPKEKLEAEKSDFVIYAIREYLKATHVEHHSDPFVFPESEAMSQAKTQWIATSDSAATFIDTYLTYDSERAKTNDGDPIPYIYKLYACATKDAGSRPLVRLRLVHRLEEHFQVKQKTVQKRGQQAKRIPGVILNDAAFSDLASEIRGMDTSWRSNLCGYHDWCQRHPGII